MTSVQRQIAVYLAWAQWCRERGAQYEQEAQYYEQQARQGEERR